MAANAQSRDEQAKESDRARQTLDPGADEAVRKRAAQMQREADRANNAS